MDSADLIRNLRDNIIKGRLTVNNFPIIDVISLIQQEDKLWVDEMQKAIWDYERFYIPMINIAISLNDKNELVGILDDMIDIFEKTPIEILNKKERIEEIGQLVKTVIVSSYKNFAENIYKKHANSTISGTRAFYGKSCVYTVITGDYDVLREPTYINENYDYICFTDNEKFKSDIWTIRYIDNIENLDQVRLARKYKILCHQMLKEYDYSIYVDGKLQIKGDFEEFINLYSKGSPLLCFPHFIRECAYVEAEACISQKKDDSQIIIEQMQGYEEESYPHNNGLIDSACLIRQHHNKNLQQVMTTWWNEVRGKSRRDQLSIGYACWKNNFRYDLTDLFIYDNKYLCKRRERENDY